MKLILLGVILFMFNCAGTRPADLGVTSGKLKPCPENPNCVSSQMDTKDSHYILPLKYSVELVIAKDTMKKIIAAESRTTLVIEKDNYLYFEFQSKLMGFVDDVEFYFDDLEKTIHIRSASRLGKSDLGVNRKRIESIRANFK
jgi:uncharacterized protein (DUF1499 family)